TNRDLKAEVAAGRFRQDLFYRLYVFPIEVAPLRDRKEDIAALASQFLPAAAKRLGKPLPRFTQAGVMQLQSYDWPGNIRELQNVIERAVILSRRGELYFDLPKVTVSGPAAAPVSSTSPANAGTLDVIPEIEMRRRERENLLAALEKTDWRIAGPGGAAELLGMKPTTLASRIKTLGVKRKPKD
ncbi:MAG: sigma 54-interacting transcriptional regulator, partial [Verrucomicrobia subdivision 3 bacterium]|nr:sigma 54-interacting transcriptional regulator [Limisphaerales bacterium]